MPVLPPRYTDLSGVLLRGRDTLENAGDERRDSSVLSVMRLRRQGENVGRDTKDGEPM